MSLIEILNALQSEAPNIFVHTEPDIGPANALNRGFEKVRGELVGWVNSDDLYTLGAIACAAQAFESNPDWLICYGKGQHIDASGDIVGDYPTLRPEAGLDGFAAGCYICQPTLAFRIPLLKMIGPLDETQKTSFDYELWLRVFSLIPERVGFLDRVQAYSRLHDECITKKMRKTVAIEGIRLGIRYLNSRKSHWASTYLDEISTTLDEDEFKSQAGEFLNEIAHDLEPSDLNRIRQAVFST